MSKLDRKAAEARLAKMEKQIEELRAIINAPVEEEALINLSGDRYYVLFGRFNNGTFHTAEYNTEDREPVNEPAALFESEEQALAYGKAFATLAELRRQPGTITPFDRSFDDNDLNWVIIPKLSSDGDCVVSVKTDYWPSKVNAMSCISPVFKSNQLAWDAISRVGSAPLAHMFKTLHHAE